MGDETREFQQTPDGDDPLDRLLRQATWPAASEASLARLGETWAGLAPRGRRLRWGGWSAAAAVLLVAMAAALVVVRKAERPVATVPEPKAVVAEKRPLVAASRAPSLWEQAALLGHGDVSAAAALDRVPPAVNSAVAALAGSPAADVRQVVARLMRAGPAHRVERHLLDLLRTAEGTSERAVIDLLGHVGTPASVPALLERYDRVPVRPALIAALARVMPVAEINARLAREHDAGAQRPLLAALVAHESPHALAAYLTFLAKSDGSPAVLAALDDVAAPPVDGLFAQLEAQRSDHRLAAARALGHINGPAISGRLASMVERGVLRREALAALMSSGGPEASRVLSTFRQVPSLASVIRSVENQLKNPF